MMIYMLNLSKIRWEIVEYNKQLNLRHEIIEDIKKGKSVQFNNNYWIGTNKQELKEIAEKIKNSKIFKLQTELQYYQNLKIKVTRK